MSYFTLDYESYRNSETFSELLASETKDLVNHCMIHWASWPLGVSGRDGTVTALDTLF